VADPMFEPKQLQVADQGLEVLWKDGHRTLLTSRYLRGNCGCAQCVDELTHERVTGVEDVDVGVYLADSVEVGRYAVNLLFSDLHSTGIYPFEFLRKLCDCPECQVLRQSGAQA